MKKGIWTGGFPESTSMDERFAIAAEAGFDGLEVVADEELVGSDARLKACAELAHRTRPVHSIMWGESRRLASADPAERECAFELSRKAIRAARLLGADTLLVIPAVVTEKVGYEQAWELGLAGLRTLIPTAEHYGVCLAVENVWNRFLLSPLEMRRFDDDAGHPLVQAYLDVGKRARLRLPRAVD